VGAKELSSSSGEGLGLPIPTGEWAGFFEPKKEVEVREEGDSSHRDRCLSGRGRNTRIFDIFGVEGKMVCSWGSFIARRCFPKRKKREVQKLKDPGKL
jgi:hypothetical protein